MARPNQVKNSKVNRKGSKPLKRAKQEVVPESESESEQEEIEVEEEDVDSEDEDEESENDSNSRKQNLEDLMDEDEDDEDLPFEIAAKEEEDAEAEILEEAAQDMRQAEAQQPKYQLPQSEVEDDEDEDDEEDEESGDIVPPAVLKERIGDVVEVLGDFKNRREEGRARSEYVNQLARDLCEYYGYIRELTDHFLDMFGPAECVEFMDASDAQRPVVIRTNTLKTRRKDLAQALIKRGVHLDPLAPWSKVGLKILESQVPVGATPEYLGGQYMIQAASSMCPVLALGPLPGERILDLAAAPGGKTSYVAQLMKNTGTILANDLKRDRLKSTVANFHRLGVKNTVVCQYNGKEFPKVMGGFDRVLLDAPCTGLGVISRDQSIKIQRTMKDIQKMAHLQKELLLAAIDSTNFSSKTGGVVVYSTCSVSVEENEKVVQYALSKRCVKLVSTSLDFGKPGFTRLSNLRFHPSMALTRRFYPHVHNMDGFYVAKFVKYANGEPSVESAGEKADAKFESEESSKSKKRRLQKERQEAKDAATKVDAQVREIGSESEDEEVSEEADQSEDEEVKPPPKKMNKKLSETKAAKTDSLKPPVQKTSTKSKPAPTQQNKKKKSKK